MNKTAQYTSGTNAGNATSGQKRLCVALVFVVFLAGISTPWFFFGRGGYNAELWLGRFDQTAWLENHTEGIHSPRRKMVKAVMRRLAPGMTRHDIEGLLGPADYEMMGWQAYRIDHPRWAAFALDHDVFEIRYEEGRLAGMRIRST